MKAAQIAKALFLGCALTVLACAALNAVVDPYAFLGTPPIRGVTSNKSTALHHDRIMKVASLKARPADCLIFGSSRVGEGMPRAHPAYEGCRQVFNASLAGPNMMEVEALWRLAGKSGELRRVWLGVDLFMFNGDHAPARGFSPVLLRDDVLSTGINVGRVLFSLDTVHDSLVTLQAGAEPPFYLTDGFVNPEVLDLALQQRSTRATFLRGIRGYILHELPPPGHDFKLKGGADDPLGHYATLLRDAQTHDIEVIVFINPAHAWQWELLAELRLWEDWEAWKRELVRVNEQVAAETGRRPYELWDFSGYHRYAAEKVPAGDGSSQRMVWYWDPSHYNTSLGRLLLDRTMQPGSDEGGFGVRLSSQYVEQHLAQISGAAARWRQANANDSDDVRAIVECFAPAAVRSRLILPRAPVATCTNLRKLTR